MPIPVEGTPRRMTQKLHEMRIVSERILCSKRMMSYSPHGYILATDTFLPGVAHCRKEDLFPFVPEQTSHRAFATTRDGGGGQTE